MLFIDIIAELPKFEMRSTFCGSSQSENMNKIRNTGRKKFNMDPKKVSILSYEN